MPILQENNTICNLRWGYPVVNFGQQAIRTCCKTPIRRLTPEEIAKDKENLFLNDEYTIQRRKEMFAGYKHNDCYSCWQTEAKGATSMRGIVKELDRLNFNDAYSKYLNSTHAVEPTSDDAILRSTKPFLLDIELSNLCDAKCVYCNRFFSTRWEKYEIEQGSYTKKAQEKDKARKTEDFEKYFWSWFEEVHKSLDTVNFIGGEPLINPKYYEYLEKIYNDYDVNNEKKLTINTVTNFNTPEIHFNRFMLLVNKLTGKFNFSLDVSIDATEDQFEFIREGIKWNRVKTNLIKFLDFKHQNVEIGFIITMTNLNVTDFINVLRLAVEIHQKYGVVVNLKANSVSMPNYLSPYLLTKEYARYYKEAREYLEQHLDQAPVGKFFNNVFSWQRYCGFLQDLENAINTHLPDMPLLKEFNKWMHCHPMGHKKNEIFKDHKAYFDFCEQL